MSDASKSGKPGGAIPVGKLIERLIQRRPGATPTVRAAQKRAPFPPVIPRYGVVVTGRLESHGAGSPPHQLGQWSYFVKILTTHGLKTFWGADLKRAIAESETQPKIHSMVGVQRIGYQILKLPSKARDTEGSGQEVRRVRWRVESVELFADRARQAREARESRFRGRDSAPRQAPQQQSSTDIERAQAFADRYMHNPFDRERFLEQVKNRLLPSTSKVVPDKRRSDKDHEPPSR